MPSLVDENAISEDELIGRMSDMKSATSDDGQEPGGRRKHKSADCVMEFTTRSPPNLLVENGYSAQDCHATNILRSDRTKYLVSQLVKCVTRQTANIMRSGVYRWRGRST